jgi:hypothetical protein
MVNRALAIVLAVSYKPRVANFPAFLASRLFSATCTGGKVNNLLQQG